MRIYFDQADKCIHAPVMSTISVDPAINTFSSLLYLLTQSHVLVCLPAVTDSPISKPTPLYGQPSWWGEDENPANIKQERGGKFSGLTIFFLFIQENIIFFVFILQ